MAEEEDEGDEGFRVIVAAGKESKEEGNEDEEDDDDDDEEDDDEEEDDDDLDHALAHLKGTALTKRSGFRGSVFARNEQMPQLQGWLMKKAHSGSSSPFDSKKNESYTFATHATV